MAKMIMIIKWNFLFYALFLVALSGCSSSSDGNADDMDSDGVLDDIDNCPTTYNPDQQTMIGNAILAGDACDDEDADSIVDAIDNCPMVSNVDQKDTDGNGIGDACVACQGESTVIDLNAGVDGSNVDYVVPANGKIYFRAYTPATGQTLFEHDPAAQDSANVTVAPKFNTGEAKSNIQELTVLDDKLYFTADDENRSFHLWVYEPGVGTNKVSDIVPDGGAVGDIAGHLTALNGKLYYSASDEVNGREIWTYDPSVGATMLADIQIGEQGSWPEDLMAFNNKLYFSAYTEALGTVLYVYDPAMPERGVSILADILTDNNDSGIDDLTVLDDKLYFVASKASGSGTTLWVHDPNNSAMNISEFNLGIDYVHIDNFVPLDGKLYFRVDQAYDYLDDEYIKSDLWVFDPAKPTTNAVPLPDIPHENFNRSPSWALAFNGKLYFVATDPVNRGALWVYDPAYPTAIATLTPETLFGNSPSYLKAVGNQLYFSSSSPMFGRELWVFDPMCDP